MAWEGKGRDRLHAPFRIWAPSVEDRPRHTPVTLGRASQPLHLTQAPLGTQVCGNREAADLLPGCCLGSDDSKGRVQRPSMSPLSKIEFWAKRNAKLHLITAHNNSAS